MSKRLATLFLGSALICAAAVSAPAMAQQAPAQPSPRISVTGEGEVSVAPDMAILNLSVLREAETAREAVAAGSEAMKQVLAALKAAGIAERDLQTAGLSLQPRYTQPGPQAKPQAPKISGYSASQGLTVRIRDLAAVGAILDKTIALGVNQGGDISFVNDDMKPSLTEARKRAVADATQRARTLAEAAGVTLGRILSIEEQSLRPGPVPMGKMMRAAAAESFVPVERGENNYRVSVDLVFEIAP
ncbi:SIMPL domain-containing protein [Bosea sp. AAP35]|uniref:SIMPL domain-containing protein n=1 Tax=Bosea sp. AAP35 TaxID=1523417 RepID=UPI0009E6EB04|nr:SIMPL domain-containing protein [Bosea sp. AAP35]